MVAGSEMLGPVVALVAWSMVMWLWMYATRIPAILSAKMQLDPNIPRGEQMATLAPNVRWKADNYNHLMEQPTVFYALAISLAVMGEDGAVAQFFAWTYVALRVIHSLVQAVINKIQLRFLLFVLSNIPLLALTVIAAMALIR
jgi:hypothetical protein